MTTVHPFAQQGNYTMVHNYVLDELMPVLGASSFKVLLCVLRKTVGWHREKDAISYSQIHEGTGIKSANTVTKALKDLAEKDLIIITVPDDPRLPYQYQINQGYHYENPTAIVEEGGSAIIEEPPTIEIIDTKESKTSIIPNGIIDPPFEIDEGDDQEIPDTPWGVYSGLEKIQRGINRGQSFKEAKTLLADGYSGEDIVACGRYLLTSSWHRENMVPLNATEIARKIDMWVGAGKPEVHSTGGTYGTPNGAEAKKYTVGGY